MRTSGLRGMSSWPVAKRLLLPTPEGRPGPGGAVLHLDLSWGVGTCHY
jgi:hypothetical protein